MRTANTLLWWSINRLLKFYSRIALFFWGGGDLLKRSQFVSFSLFLSTLLDSIELSTLVSNCKHHHNYSIFVNIVNSHLFVLYFCIYLRLVISLLINWLIFCEIAFQNIFCKRTKIFLIEQWLIAIVCSNCPSLVIFEWRFWLFGLQNGIKSLSREELFWALLVFKYTTRQLRKNSLATLHPWIASLATPIRPRPSIRLLRAIRWILVGYVAINLMFLL